VTYIDGMTETLPGSESVPEYYLLPCSGADIAGTSPNHVYLVSATGQTNEEIGWMTLDEVQARFPNAQLTTAASHTLCPPCDQVFRGAEDAFKASKPV
jgi:hypothetical protein